MEVVLLIVVVAVALMLFASAKKKETERKFKDAEERIEVLRQENLVKAITAHHLVDPRECEFSFHHGMTEMQRSELWRQKLAGRKIDWIGQVSGTCLDIIYFNIAVLENKNNESPIRRLKFLKVVFQPASLTSDQRLSVSPDSLFRFSGTLGYHLPINEIEINAGVLGKKQDIEITNYDYQLMRMNR